MPTLKEVLLKTHKNLQLLEEKKARQGSDPDIKLLNEIEDHQTAIELLTEAISTDMSEVTLEQLKAALRPLLIPVTYVEGINVDDLKPDIPKLSFEPDMVKIPAGPFLMGSDLGEKDEAPRHEVKLPAYQIGKYPITNAQYAEFIKQDKTQEPPRKVGWFLREPPPDKLDHPVVGVSWYEALAYCRWLSQQTNQARLYRLPTEAEWEKATAWDGQKHNEYPWGDTFEAGNCNAGTAGLGDTTPVGRYSPQGDSPWGCADMAGNVQEWTSTLWGSDSATCDFPYPYKPNDGREDLEAEQHLHRVYRVCRGGSYRDDAPKVRCASRGQSSPDSKLKWRGFRVVLEI